MFPSSILLIGMALTLQHDQSSSTLPLDGLFHCETITELNDRNTCFSTETAKLRSAVSSGTLIVADQRFAREQSVANFGKHNEDTLSSRLSIEAPEQISSTIASSGQIADGKYRFTLTDGSSWLQTDSDPIRLRPRDGADVTVKRAALGSFFLRIGSGRDIRVRRIN